MQARREKKRLTKKDQARLEQLEDLDNMTTQEIADEIQASRNLKDAYKKLGLTNSEVTAARINYQKLRRG